MKRGATFGVVLVAALAGAVFHLAWLSRGWPLIHDAPLMHYVAWLIEHGAVPYRDIFDMNAPGAYLAHLAVLRTLGGGDLAWRVFDLGWLSLTALLLALYARPFGAGAAAVSALLFALYHLAGGVWLAGQRDFLLSPFLVAGLLLVAPPVRTWRLALAGLVAGAAVALKPPAVLFLVLITGAAAVAGRRDRRGWRRAALAVVAGGAVMLLACLAWLAWMGGLGAFVETFAGYVLPLYSKLARVSPWTALGWWPYGARVWTLFGVLALAACAVRPWEMRRGLALAGVAYGAAHFLAQGKGWEYQLDPLALFASLAAGLALSAARPARWVALLALVALSGQLYVKGLRETDPDWIRAKVGRASRIVADLDGRVGPGETVQVLDTGEGGIHALYALGLRQPTRFIYDFHFYHDVDRPFIRGLRDEFVGALAARPPRFIVLLERGWPSGGYERLSRFPALESWIESAYGIDRQGDGYRIYAKRAGS